MTPKWKVEHFFTANIYLQPIGTLSAISIDGFPNFSAMALKKMITSLKKQKIVILAGNLCKNAINRVDYWYKSEIKYIVDLHRYSANLLVFSKIICSTNPKSMGSKDPGTHPHEAPDAMEH